MICKNFGFALGGNLLQDGKNMLKRLSLGLLIACTLTAATPVLADEPITSTQEASTLPAKPTERVVEAVEIRFSDTQSLSEQAVRSHIELKAGDRFTQAAMDRSVKALFGTGYFENVYATPQEKEAGRVTVTFELTGKLKIRTLNFEGNKHIKAKKLKIECGLKENESLGAVNLAEAVRKLKAYYSKKNYTEAKIVTRTTPLENAGLADVTFVIDEGKKVKINAIRFEGNTHVKSKALIKVMVTKKASFWSFFTGSGKVEEEKTTDDLQLIGEYYRNLGYLEVKVSGPGIVPQKDGVALTYTIDEGARYYMGVQTIEGNTLFSNEQISKCFKLKTGAPLAADAVEQTSRGIRDLYGSKGYLETLTRTEMLAGETSHILNVKYSIKESPQFTVNTINISGNTTTKNIVIARELLLAPGDVFSSTKMKTSEARLQNTGYFSGDKESQVRLTDEKPVDAVGENQRDLNVAVTEGKTGNISFGAGYGSLDKASVFGEFTQGNFDIGNPKNFFRGAGQKFRLYASLGTQSNQIITSFEEPWILQHRIAGGFSVYRTETEYLSTQYNERRTGFELYLRKRLFELIDGRLGYRRENVSIFDVDNAASQAIKDEAGTRSVSKVTFNMTRDTRDKVLFSTSGNRLELDTTWAGHGLGGDTDYWAVEGRAAQYFHSFEWPTPQYITLLGRMGTMDGFGNSRVPLFDRYFLGGPSTLRGFGYRKVGPKDASDEPLGGKSYGFWSLEYAFQVADPLQLAAFYDAGFLNTDTADFSTGNYYDNYGLGMRLMVMGAPLRLDYGMPLTARGQSKSGHFWFSFGTRF